MALILSSVLKLGKSSLKDATCVAIFLAVLVLAFFLGVSPVILVVAAGAAGYGARALQSRKAGEAK